MRTHTRCGICRRELRIRNDRKRPKHYYPRSRRLCPGSEGRVIEELEVLWGRRLEAAEVRHFWVRLSSGRWLPVCGHLVEPLWSRPIEGKVPRCVDCASMAVRLEDVDNRVRDLVCRRYPHGTPAYFLRQSLGLPLSVTSTAHVEDLVPPDLFLTPALERLIELGELGVRTDGVGTTYWPLAKLREARGIARVSF